MDLEPSEHEPDEYDPEAEFRDPTSDSLTIPDVSGNAGNTNPQLTTQFWVLVMVIKAALIALSLGALFLIFQTNQRFGWLLLGGGLLLTMFALRRYRDVSATLEAAEDEETTTTDEMPEDA
ncbi:hypothetical protein OB919_01125 [Halobacteria archaeon AArc-curdl1]|uniref:DUF7322 domain-containing protein n=1 Tax=Natronosalvus hydrolyticus TaxID=2979988 RepID=A0AAP2Z5P3_9EURY|nr:hypothetical protein [Halobacteria archaeon AArc-curdl1]